MKFTGERFLLGGSSNRTKVDAIVKYIFASFFVQDKTVLDIACGSGFGTFLLAQEAREVTGVDVSPEAVEHAENNFSRNNIKFDAGDALEYNYPQNYFDVVVSFQTIEHLVDPQKFLDLLKSSLKDDGLIILATPDKKIVSPFTEEPIGEFHKFEFYKKELQAMFDKIGLNAKWYGQRATFKPLTWWVVRRAIRVVEVLLNKKFGFYGGRESYEIVPLKFWHEPKDFVVVLTKKE